MLIYSMPNALYGRLSPAYPVSQNWHLSKAEHERWKRELEEKLFEIPNPIREMDRCVVDFSVMKYHEESCK
jgi:hypothetical protein